MADIAVTSRASTNKRMDIVESFVQMTLPAGEAVAAGAPVRLDPTSGKWLNANATDAAHARAWGIATGDAALNQPVTAIRYGVLDGFTLTGNYGTDVFISNTNGRLADAAGTTSATVGHIIPATAVPLGTAYDKLLFVDMRQPT